MRSPSRKQALLPHLPLRGRVVTAGALHTQTALAQVIVAHGGDYLLCVKGNQGRLYEEPAVYFADPHATARSVTAVDRQRGRTETCTLHASTRLNAYLARYWAFPRLGQVIRLLRTVCDRTGLHTEIVYVITSLTPRRADPARLLALIRGHWSVESRHWVRDVTFGEDRSRLRMGHAPQIMAAFRNLAHTLIRRSGTTEIAAQRRAFAARPAAALRLLLPKTRSRGFSQTVHPPCLQYIIPYLGWYTEASPQVCPLGPRRDMSMATPASTPRQSLTERAYELTRHDIMSGILLPREALVESELAARYGMSKTPVREALLALAQIGLVETNAFRGWRVRYFGAQDASEIYQLREILEPFAVRQAVPHMGDTDAAALRAQLWQGRTAIERGNLVELSRLNRAFHRALYAQCGNSRLVEILDRMQDQLQVMALRTWQTNPSYTEEAEQHEAILAAIEAGDADLAAERLRAHIVEFRKRYTSTHS